MRLADKLASELVDYGGFAIPRWRVYEHVLETTGSRSTAGAWAYGWTRTLPPDEAANYPGWREFLEGREV